MVMTVEGSEKILRLLDIVGDFVTEKRLKFTVKKSQVMRNKWDKGERKEWEMGGVIMEEGEGRGLNIGTCGEYKYLGVTLRSGGSRYKGHMEVTERKVWKLMGIIQRVSRFSFNKMWVAKV